MPREMPSAASAEQLSEMPAASAFMFQASGITCRYGPALPPVVREVSLSVGAGKCLCILGPNGCGKTTLLRALAGILPHEGTVTLGSQRLDMLPPRQRARYIALMSQLSAAGFSYSVYETVMLGRYAHQKGGLLVTEDEGDRRIVQTCMEMTGTWSLRDRNVTELSGGQLQRVLLARTFAQTPQVLLLDEPTNHLDLRYQVDLVETVKAWADGSTEASPRCVIAVLHDINLALSLADTLLLLSEGRVVAHGRSQDFDLRLLDGIYGLDVRAYMRRSLARWEEKKDDGTR